MSETMNKRKHLENIAPVTLLLLLQVIQQIMNPIILIISLALIATHLYKKWKLPQNFPPGPANLPVLGAILHLSDNLLESFLTLRSKYGNIFGLRIGPTPTVVISDFKTCVQLFKDANFSARPTYLTEVMGSVMHQAEDHPSPNRGVVFSSGSNWDTQRKFVLKKLSEFGVGKSKLEGTVAEQVEMLVKVLRKQAKTGSVKLGERFSISLVNSIWNIVTGSQFDLDDPLIHSIYKGIDSFIDSHRLIGVFMVFPWLRHLISYLGGALENMKANVRNMMKAIVDDHIKTFNDGYERDLVDAFIGKIKEADDPKSSFFGKRGRTNLEQNMLELFGAGANPVATTLSFCFLYLARMPEVQDKVFKEISDNCGADSVITLEHLKHLPYTNAFIHEVLRITAINFIGTPHMNISAAKIDNYDLPAGTTVFAFLWYILNDPEYWTNPRELNPERFLDESGSFVKDERLIPFLVGRRQCLGMALAQTEMFLFFTNIIRQFKVSEDRDSPLPDPTPTMGFVMGCPEYQVRMEER